MYLGSHKPQRRDSPWRVLVLVVLIVGGLYVVREQLTGARWTRPFDATPTPTRTAESYFDEGEALYEEGLLDEAIVAYQKAFQADPLDNGALFHLVRLMVIRHRTAEVFLRGLLVPWRARVLGVLGLLGGHLESVRESSAGGQKASSPRCGTTSWTRPGHRGNELLRETRGDRGPRPRRHGRVRSPGDGAPPR